MDQIKEITHRDLLDSYLEQQDQAFQAAREKKLINRSVGHEFGNGSRIVSKVPRRDDDGDIIGYAMQFEFSAQDEIMDLAAGLQQSIISMLGMRGMLGKSILEALWKVYRDGLVTYLGEYNPEDFRQWAEKTLLDHDESKYIPSLLFVVERILQDVHAKNKSQNPYRQADKRPITVENLIAAKGSTSKLIEISYVYTLPSTTDENRQEMLEMIMSGKTREAVKDKRDEVSGTKETIKLPYIVKERGDGLFDLSMTGLTLSQVKVFEALTKGVRDQQI